MSYPRWTQLDKTEKASWWTAFNAVYNFQPGSETDPYPGIVEPKNSITFDLRGSSSPPRARVNTEAEEAFRTAFPSDTVLIALNWQHPGYRFRPHGDPLPQNISPIPVYPDGDYYLFFTEDLQCGTFGHPWHKTLCVFGEPLLSTLAEALSTWLPVARRGGHEPQ
ncbi:DUF2716 domain-containing protein [Rhodococcus triatomae]|uniref:DUF2716 domain-containing protein n=1 Tax=Rhodococcus triatomae TaxID=300028 RepID=UPI000A799223|nr:DUF2716 domain-containing protein [Rhodococcus triatomae]QNG19944.1 DUF2716 domain-containing protein [Rhodococcus triatomae]QNG24141.1 DUF2716 domain-containing protein [Rhodococcus triatomae]